MTFFQPGTNSSVWGTTFARPKGGAIRLSSGSLTMTNSRFDNNVNLGGDGGAVDVAFDGTVSVSNCSFVRNVAKRNDIWTGFGGGMTINAARIVITNSLFDGNIAGDVNV